MNVKRMRATVVLCFLGFTLFTIPVGVTADEWREECYPAYVITEGNMTLTNDLSFNITIQANFTAMVPTQLTHGDYNASFDGDAHVSNETIKFRGDIVVNEFEFDASFTVPNTFLEIPTNEEEEEEHESEHHHGYLGHNEKNEEPHPEEPEAHFTYWSHDPYVNETVTFDASDSHPNGGEIISYEWDFGDITTDSGMIVNHNYTRAEIYLVTLNVTDSEGLWSVESKAIHVRDQGAEPHEPWEEHEPEEEYDASGELEITITQISAVPKEKAWVKIKGYINSYGGQPAFGWLKAKAKFGEWAKVQAFFMPGGWTWGDEPEVSFHNADVTMEGNLTLTCMSESIDITIEANFKARIPEEVESGTYTASYEGSAYVTEGTVRFRGELSVDDEEFPVEFIISNEDPELPAGHCKASGELTVIITWLPAKYFEYAFYAAKLVSSTMVELNYSGNDFYISGLWDVYNITWSYYSEKNFTWTVESVVVNGTGEFNVTGGWKDFTLDITGIELVSGKVVFLCYRSFVIPPGDVNGDYIVDIFDLVHIGKRYGTKPGLAEFDFDLDFNDDFEIDIYDLTTMGANLGEEY